MQFMQWQPIESAPTDGREVLAAFRGQFQWVIFTARCCNQPYGVYNCGYAKPTHWMPLPAPPKDATDAA